MPTTGADRHRRLSPRARCSSTSSPTRTSASGAMDGPVNDTPTWWCSPATWGARGRRSPGPCGWDKPVLYAPGKHEFWRQHRRPAGGTGACRKARRVRVLDQREVRHIDGVRFLGATLWTDFELFGEPQRRCGRHEPKRSERDGRHPAPAETGAELFKPDDAAYVFQRHAAPSCSASWRSEHTGETVVITHHAPIAAQHPPALRRLAAQRPLRLRRRAFAARRPRSGAVGARPYARQLTTGARHARGLWQPADCARRRERWNAGLRSRFLRRAGRVVERTLTNGLEVAALPTELRALKLR